MTETAKETASWGAGSQNRQLDVDHHVGARMRERRIMLGLTLQQTAELIGISFRQAREYEKGITPIAAGRLYVVAETLGVDVGYFFEGARSYEQAWKATPQQRMLLELARNFLQIEDRDRQEALCALARALADYHDEPDRGSNDLQESRVDAPVKFAIKLMDVWALNEKEAAKLLGFEDEEIFLDLMSGATRLNTRDARDRVRHLLRTREALHSLFRDVHAEREWLREPRPEFNDQSPLALLLEGSMENFLVVSQFVQRMVGR